VNETTIQHREPKAHVHYNENEENGENEASYAAHKQGHEWTKLFACVKHVHKRYSEPDANLSRVF
jgi:hypothetical protein